MKRLIPIAILATALLAPQAASARVIELGGNLPQAAPSCPEDCAAIGRVTGYGGTGRGTGARTPYRIPRAGKIVAFTVPLGKPDQTQTDFFESTSGGPGYGSPPKIRLSVLRPGNKRRTRANHRLTAQSEDFRVDRYFGSVPTFALDSPIKVGAGAIVGITTTTWLPNLAVTVGKDQWWRSSRPTDTCKNITQRAALVDLRTIEPFGCSYFGERPLYSVTFIPDPRPTSGGDDDS